MIKMTDPRSIPDKNVVMIGGSGVSGFYEETSEEFEHWNIRATPRSAWVGMAISCYVQFG